MNNNFYYEKYLKYKNKYLSLKNNNLLHGGNNFSLCFVYNTTSDNMFKEFLPDIIQDQLKILERNGNQIQKIFNSNEIKPYLSECYENINDSINDFMVKLPSTDSNEISYYLSEIYDIITNLYLISDEYTLFWNNIYEEIHIPIKIFVGENASIKQFIINQTDHINFINGINILLGCSTKKLASELNKDYNIIGKYFIGIDGFLHTYSNSLIRCNNALKINKDEFIKEWDSLGTLPNVVKIINIFMKYIQADCDNCNRNCYIIKENNIKDKLKNIATKINSPHSIIDKLLGDRDHFNSTNSSYCSESTKPCSIDIKYEKYFIKLDDEYQIKLAKKEEIKKREEEELKKRKEEMVSIYNKYMETPDDTNITINYKLYFNNIDLQNFEEKFDIERIEDGFLITKDNYKYLLFFQKKNNTEFFKLVDINDTDPDSILFIDNKSSEVDENGYEKSDDYEYQEE